MKKLVILGAGAYLEVAQIIADINKKKATYEVVTLLDDNTDLHKQKIGGAFVEGSLDLAKNYPDAFFVFAIGSSKARLVRHGILKRLGLQKERFENIIHPEAKIFDDVEMGYGNIIYMGVVIFSGSKIHNYCQILPNTVIGVNNVIEEGALITANVSTTASVTIGAYSHIGTSSAIAEGVKVGAGAQVGMGTVALKNIPEGAFALGNPPRFLDKVEVPPEILQK